MLNIYIIIALAWVHYVADFQLQSDYMAKNKSKSNTVLLAHCAVYAACMFVFGIYFGLVNFALHFATDWCTSRWSSRIYKKSLSDPSQVHWFFCVIGFDQAIHITTLVLTFMWIGNL